MKGQEMDTNKEYKITEQSNYGKVIYLLKELQTGDMWVTIGKFNTLQAAQAAQADNSNEN